MQGQRAVDDRMSGQSSASEADRGRRASTPAEIPTKGWKDVALRIYDGINEDRILALAAGVTFYVLLALFPGIAGLIALYGLYADASTISQHLDTLAGVFPEGGLQIIREQIERLAAQPAQRLGIATIMGLGVSLWSANGGMKAMFDALNVVYHEKEKRSHSPQLDFAGVHAWLYGVHPDRIGCNDHDADGAQLSGSVAPHGAFDQGWPMACSAAGGQFRRCAHLSIRAES